jgi:hypothetical protein
MDQIESLLGISGDEDVPAIEPIAAAGDFHFANKRKRIDLSQRRNSHEHAVDAHDEAVLSDVARVSLLEEEGMSVSAIATELGLTTALVLTDLGVAAQICHPSASK